MSIYIIFRQDEKKWVSSDRQKNLEELNKNQKKKVVSLNRGKKKKQTLICWTTSFTFDKKRHTGQGCVFCLHIYFVYRYTKTYGLWWLVITRTGEADGKNNSFYCMPVQQIFENFLIFTFKLHIFIPY